MDIKEREFKTTPQQWKIVVDYFQEYPALLKSKFNNFDGDNREISQLWEELANALNAVGVGTRSVEKWKMAIGRWKSKTKAKASLLRQEMVKTGGGPLTVPLLTPTEEKLMGLLGWKSITGDSNPELGFLSKQSTSYRFTEASTSQWAEASTSQWAEASTNQCTEASTSSSLPSLVPIGSRENKVERTIPLQSGLRCKKRKIRTTSDKSKKYVSLQKMHTESLEKLNQIEKNTSIMASALMSISADVNRYVNFVTEQK